MICFHGAHCQCCHGFRYEGPSIGHATPDIHTQLKPAPSSEEHVFASPKLTIFSALTLASLCDAWLYTITFRSNIVARKSINKLSVQTAIEKKANKDNKQLLCVSNIPKMPVLWTWWSAANSADSVQSSAQTAFCSLPSVYSAAIFHLKQNSGRLNRFSSC